MHFFATAPADPSLKAQNPMRLKRLLPYLKPYRLAIAGALLALLVTSSTVLSLGQALRYLIDEGLSKNNPALLDRAYEIFVLVTAVLALATYARFYFISYVGERVIADIRAELYRHLLRLDVGFFETTSTGELLSRLSTDTTLLQTLIGSSVSIALRNFLLLLGGLALMLVTSPRLTAYALVLVPLVITPILVLGRRVRTLSRESQARVADISAQAEETFGGIRTVQAFSLEAREQQRFTGRIGTALDVALKRIRMRALLTGAVISLVFGAVITMLWIGGKEALAGTITHGELSAFVLYAFIVAGAVGALSEVTGSMQQAAGATERISELLAVNPVIVPPAHPLALPEPFRGRVAFEKISFAYPARPQHRSLEHFSLTVEPGEKVALVGPSGAGKTTVLQLLLRFYDPAEGRILLDGVDITSLDPVSFRGKIGIVQQEPLIFSTTAEENIRMGNPEATSEQVREAAAQAMALEFIEKLPQGFATHLGEKGVQLSGGQRQRIAIARAILRDPKILLLDEATSSLDAENERLIQQALERVMKGRTTLIIAHRLATVLSADRIVVMNEGQIEAAGTHATLLNSSPLYARLAKLQFHQAA